MDNSRQFCLDLLRVEWQNGSKSMADCAILLEIWSSGGLLQTNYGIPVGTGIAITSLAESVSAKITRCDQDEYGFIIEIATETGPWFPGGYRPANILASDFTSSNNGTAG